jgi:tetratricopeptide (TPR) repeat protein
MKHSGPLRPSTRRLIFLVGFLALAGAALGAQRAWLSPEARERRIAATPLDQLEKRAGDSRDPLLFYYLARGRSEVADMRGAIAAAEQAVQLDPNFARARASLGTLLLSAGRETEALQQLNAARDADPGSVDAYLGLALFYQRFEGWDRVATFAEVVTRLAPENVSAWILRGQAAAQLGQQQQAAGFYERAAGAAPQAAVPLALASRARLALDDVDAAEKEAREAVRLDPKDAGALAALGFALLRRGKERLPEAARAFEQAIALGETSGDAYFGLGRAYEQQARFLDAEQDYRLALRADHTRNDARYGLFQVLRAQGRDAEARTVASEFHDWVALEEQRNRAHDRAAAHRDDPRAWFALARVEARMGLWASARRNVESGIRRAPNDAEGRRLRVEIEGHAQ